MAQHEQIDPAAALARVDEVQRAMRRREEAAAGLNGWSLAVLALCVAAGVGSAALKGATADVVGVAALALAFPCWIRADRRREALSGIDVTNRRKARVGHETWYDGLIGPIVGAAALLNVLHAPLPLAIAAAVLAGAAAIVFVRRRRRLVHPEAPAGPGGLPVLAPAARDVAAALAIVDSATSVAIAEVTGLAESVVRDTADGLVASGDVEHRRRADPPVYAFTRLGRERFAAELAALER